MDDLPGQSTKEQNELQEAIDMLINTVKFFGGKESLPQKEALKKAVGVCYRFLCATVYDTEFPEKIPEELRDLIYVVDFSKISGKQVLAMDGMLNECVGVDEKIALYVKLQKDLNPGIYEEAVKKLKI